MTPLGQLVLPFFQLSSWLYCTSTMWSCNSASVLVVADSQTTFHHASIPQRLGGNEVNNQPEYEMTSHSRVMPRYSLFYLSSLLLRTCSFDHGNTHIFSYLRCDRRLWANFRQQRTCSRSISTGHHEWYMRS